MYNPFGHAVGQQVKHPGMAMRRHYNQVDTEFLLGFYYFVGGVADANKSLVRDSAQALLADQTHLPFRQLGVMPCHGGTAHNHWIEMRGNYMQQVEPPIVALRNLLRERDGGDETIIEFDRAKDLSGVCEHLGPPEGSDASRRGINR